MPLAVICQFELYTLPVTLVVISCMDAAIATVPAFSLAKLELTANPSFQALNRIGANSSSMRFCPCFTFFALNFEGHFESEAFSASSSAISNSVFPPFNVCSFSKGNL
jgi:hypothetical protein